MAVTTEPEALLSHLHKADGSATYSYAGYTVIGAVNGPIEAQKRDELPEEAIIDVVVRPAAGVGGTRERHLESLIQSTLRQIVLVNNFPRSLIQIILQITVIPENEYLNGKIVQANVNLPVLPALLQAAILSLLSASVPMTATLTSTSLAVGSKEGQRQVIANPTARQIEQSQSFHVLAFTSQNDLILAESEGVFTMMEWDNVYEAARNQCCTTTNADETDTLMKEGIPTEIDLKRFIRSTVEEKTASDLYWK
ncbi:putative exosome complex subunit rrp46 protein [Rosellinia necatrix]|uniref:Putative exosome complex subunit rrp46 protein n=1 Tax=Rosellinia necatrix TaxID=77044 RepID=A0A1S7UKA4_ROSNE|nr:putative exosome complex subunit rrp46 protein [Rosellinia necatrix]